MRSTKCVQCGFVGWLDGENCKSCGAPLNQRSANLPLASPHSDPWDQPEGQKKGLAIFALVLGILSFFTFGLLGIGAIVGIIVAARAMSHIRREPWKYGGRSIAIAGLVLSITSLVSAVPVAIIAAIAIPNLMASLRAANEGSAIHSLRVISAAEYDYQNKFHKFGTLEDLAANGLVDPKLATGTKNGYNFTVVVDSSNPEAFEVIGVPVTYGSTGRRSFYVDETFVIRGADNNGGPSSKLDPALGTDRDYPSLAQPAGYRSNTDY